MTKSINAYSIDLYYCCLHLKPLIDILCERFSSDIVLYCIMPFIGVDFPTSIVHLDYLNPVFIYKNYKNIINAFNI